MYSRLNNGPRIENNEVVVDPEPLLTTISGVPAFASTAMLKMAEMELLVELTFENDRPGHEVDRFSPSRYAPFNAICTWSPARAPDVLIPKTTGEGRISR